jgi:hypothetical protein
MILRTQYKLTEKVFNMRPNTFRLYTRKVKFSKEREEYVHRAQIVIKLVTIWAF